MRSLSRRAMLALMAGALAAGLAHDAATTSIAQERPASTPTLRGSKPAVAAFIDVNVLPMDRERVLTGQTVIVRDGRIEWVGPAAQARIPSGAVRIPGAGKYLMPGLAEMHAHVPPQQPPEQELNDILFLYVANGITTIRGMLGSAYQIPLRERLAKGEIVGPTLYAAAPSLNGNSAPDPATAARLVREHKKAGYDLLKLHPGLSRASYDSIVAVSRAVGITWAGHVSEAVGIDHTLETRQSTIEHLDGYLEGAVSDAMERRIASPTDTVRPAEIWRAVDESRLLDLARRTKQAGVWNVPTMVLWETLFSQVAPESLARAEELKYVSRTWVSNWTQGKRNRLAQDAQMGITADDARHFLATRRRLLKMLADAGAPLLMGTDTPQLFNVPGFALHRELKLAGEAGLTPYQVLESGTRNVGRYVAESLRQDGRFGTIAAGSRADLVLLDANPLQDLANLKRRAGVMVRGRWLTEQDLREGLAEIAARMSAS